MRKRLILATVAVAVITCVILGTLAMLPPRPGVTKANFERIKRGMTRNEVEAILGKPNMNPAHGDITSAWGDAEKNTTDVAVWYDQDGQLRIKAWLRK